MFDWPDPSHTSPTSTSLTVIAALSFLPAIVIVYGPPDFSFANRTIHVPVASAVADFVWPLNFTVIFSPGSAVPQMGTCMPFCSTMWSLIKALGFTSARAEAARNSVAQRDETSRRVFIGTSKGAEYALERRRMERRFPSAKRRWRSACRTFKECKRAALG